MEDRDNDQGEVIIQEPVTSSLAEYLDDAVEVDEQTWVIADAGLASWGLRKVAEIRRRAAEDQALADAETARVKEWLEGRLAKYGRDESFFLGHLRGFHERALATDPKAKTISLPNGELRARKAPDRWVIEDEYRVIQWAEQTDANLVRTTVALDRNALKKRLTVKGDQVVDPDSGELVKGITIEEGQVNFSVSVSDD